VLDKASCFKLQKNALQKREQGKSQTNFSGVEKGAQKRFGKNSPLGVGAERGKKKGGANHRVNRTVLSASLKRKKASRLYRKRMEPRRNEGQSGNDDKEGGSDKNTTCKNDR